MNFGGDIKTTISSEMLRIELRKNLENHTKIAKEARNAYLNKAMQWLASRLVLIYEGKVPEIKGIDTETA